MPRTLVVRGIAISRVGYAGIIIRYRGENLCIDPGEDTEHCSYILCTHSHRRHCTEIESSSLVITSTRSVKPVLPGEEVDLGLFKVLTYHAYNDPELYGGRPPHPKGSGVGYTVEASNSLKIYYVGDSNLVQEVVEASRGVDILVVPIGGGCVMTPEEAAELTKYSRPFVVIPIHYDNTSHFARFRDIVQPYAQVVQLKR